MIRDNEIEYKLDLPTTSNAVCKALNEHHFIVRGTDSASFEILALVPLKLNETVICLADGFKPFHNLD